MASQHFVFPIIAFLNITLQSLIALGTGDLQLMSSLSNLKYENTLKIKSSIDSDFLDFSHLKVSDDGAMLAFENATFTANSSTGLELVSQTRYLAGGIKFFDRSLPVTSDWQIDVKVHVANSLPEFPNSFYYAVINIGKLGSDFLSSAANRVILSLTRSKQTSSTVSLEYVRNTINSGIWTNSASDLGAPPLWKIDNEDVYLRIKYFSSNKSCYLYTSLDASHYELVKSYSLGGIWSLGSENSIYVALSAGSEPFQTLSESNENSNTDFNLSPGQIYFSDFKITPIVTAPSGLGSSSGGAPSGGGESKKKVGKGKSSSVKKSSGKKSSGKKSKKK